MSGRRGSGRGSSFVRLRGSGRPHRWEVCIPSGKNGHHPGWKPLQGSAAIVSQAGLQARAGSPDPLRGTVRTSARVFTGSVPRLKHPLPSARKGVRGRVCGASSQAGLLFLRLGQYLGVLVLGNLGNLVIGNLRNRCRCGNHAPSVHVHAGTARPPRSAENRGAKTVT